MLGAIIGIWASKDNVESEYFTSALYPFLVEDSMVMAIPSSTDGVLWESPNDIMSLGIPTLPGGTLIATIAYPEYNDGLPEPMVMAIPTLQVGTLIATIAYPEYNDGLPEPMVMAIPTLQAGTLQTVIAYPEYNNGLPEPMVMAIPTLQSGVLS